MPPPHTSPFTPLDAAGSGQRYRQECWFMDGSSSRSNMGSTGFDSVCCFDEKRAEVWMAPS